MSRENELALIGSIMVDPEKVMNICMNAGVAPDWWQDGKCLTMWLAVKRLWDEKRIEVGDFVSILDALKRVMEDEGLRKKNPRMAEATAKDLQDCIDGTPTSAHAEYYLTLVRGDRAKRMGRRLAREFGDALEAGVGPAVQKFMRAIVDLVAEENGGRDVSVGSTCRKVMAKFEEAHRIRMVEKRMDYTPGLAMPWRVMTVLYNGMEPGLHIVGARPSVGKTALTLNLIRYWCEHLKVGVALNSLDMELQNLMSRPMSEVSRVSLAKARFGTTSERDLERLRESVASIEEWPLYTDVIRDLESFRSWCITMKSKHDVGVIVVDFLQLMTFEGCYRMGVDDRTAHISATLKGIAVDLNVPVVALSQLNRRCEEDGGREPTASDLRGSGALEQDAMSILLLHMDVAVRHEWKLCAPHVLTPFGKTKEASALLARDIRPVWAILAKNQNGRTGRLPLVLYPNYFLFMMGDYNAETQFVEREGRRKKEELECGKFGRVLPDWRKDRIEEALRKSGGLVTEYADGE